MMRAPGAPDPEFLPDPRSERYALARLERYIGMSVRVTARLGRHGSTKDHEIFGTILRTRTGPPRIVFRYRSDPNIIVEFRLDQVIAVEICFPDGTIGNTKPFRQYTTDHDMTGE